MTTDTSGAGRRDGVRDFEVSLVCAVGDCAESDIDSNALQ